MWMFDRSHSATLVAVLMMAGVTAAQESRDRNPLEPAPERDRERPNLDKRHGGVSRNRLAPRRDDQTEQGTPEGLPQMRGDRDGEVRPYLLPPDLLPPERTRWILGVHAYNTDTGVVITRVHPGSAAARRGLERGDRIVTVAGYQVGYVGQYLYPLGEELQRHAGRDGTAGLLVQNVRNRALANIDVRLDRRHGEGRRDRRRR